MYKKRTMLFLCAIFTAHAADRQDVSNNLLLQFSDGIVEAPCASLEKFDFFKNIVGSGNAVPMDFGTAEAMKSILKETGPDYSQMTTKQVVEVADLLDHLEAPKNMFATANMLLQDRFASQGRDIVAVFDAHGSWKDALKQKCMSMVRFLGPFDKIDDFELHKRFDVEEGFRLKGCSILGTYALLSKKNNFREKTVKIIATSSGEVLSTFPVTQHTIAFSDFHDSLLMCCDDTNKTIEFIDCLALDQKEFIDFSQTQIPAMYAHSLAPDAKTLAIGGIRSLALFDRKDNRVQIKCKTWGKPICLKYTHDGNCLAVVEKDLSRDSERLFLFDAHTLDPLWEGGSSLKVPGFRDLAISPDDKKIVFVSREKAKVISLKDYALIAGTSLSMHRRGKRAFYCNDIPLSVSDVCGNKDACRIHLAPYFGERSMYCPRRAIFSSNGKLLRENYLGSDGKFRWEISVYDTDLKMEKATLKELPLSLFYVLGKDSRNPVDPAVIAAHVKVLEDIRPNICSADRKIIDGLLERFGKKKSCTVS